MYKGKDLVAGEGFQMNKWVNVAMRTLFTNEEILTGCVVKKSNSLYQQLDPKRIDLLKEALFVRWSVKLCDEVYVWKIMQDCATRVCYEARRTRSRSNKISLLI
jgi:hypothetical protein